MEVSVRRAILNDAPGITAVLWTSRRHAMPWLIQRHTEAETRHWVEHMLLATSTGWVAIEQAQIVGYAALDGDMLEQLYILPDYQGRGIGARLLGIAQNAAGDRLRLYVFARNANARRFYERHGFILVAESDGTRNEEREPDVLYEWQRTATPSETA